MLDRKSSEVRAELLAWYRAARKADWSSVADVWDSFPDADYVGELLVFNIRQNRYRLIVFPVFPRRKLYIKALLDHKEYDRKDWRSRWP